jgi:Uma2 family endonuclease
MARVHRGGYVSRREALRIGHRGRRRTDLAPGKQVELVTQLVWVVDPEGSEVPVYRRDGTLSVLRESDSLDGEDVLPGFSCPLRQVLS